MTKTVMTGTWCRIKNEEASGLGIELDFLEERKEYTAEIYRMQAIGFCLISHQGAVRRRSSG